MSRDPIVRRIVDVDYSARSESGHVIVEQSRFTPFYTGDRVYARQGCAMHKGFIELIDDERLYIVVDWDS